MGGSCINRKLEHLDVYCIGLQVSSLDEAPEFCRELSGWILSQCVYSLVSLTWCSCSSFMEVLKTV